MPQSPPTSPAALGVAAILGATLVMTFADAMVKASSGDLSLWQIYVSRSLGALPLLLALALALRAPLLPRAGGWTLLRSALLALMWLVYYAALPMMSLSVAAVALYIAPLLIALMSARMTGERVGPRKWAALLIGFGGVLVIMRPASDAFSWAALLPAAGAFLYALAMVLTRAKCLGEPPLTLALYLNLALLVTGLAALAALWGLGLPAETAEAYPFLLTGWRPMTGADWRLMALLGILMIGYSALVGVAYQIAPPAIVATFGYSYLVFAALWSFALFAEIPDGPTLAGMAMIAAAGLMTLAPARRAAAAAS